MFVDKAETYPTEEPFLVLQSRVGSYLIYKHKTRLERLARDKCSSLLWNVVTYLRVKFYNIGPRRANFTKTFPTPNLQSCKLRLCKVFIKLVVQLVNNARYTSNDKLSSISDRLWSATNDKFSNRRYDDFLSGPNVIKRFKAVSCKVL